MAEQQTFVVTGAASGIGLATAKKLLSSGARVFAIDTMPIPDDARSDDFIQLEQVDISNQTELSQALESISAQASVIDGLVCSAGVIAQPCQMDDITEEAARSTIDVNLLGTFWTIKTFGPYIQKTSQAGSIVVISSVDGIIGEPYAPIYSATKAALISLTKSFARHFGEPLVRVNAVAPGLIDTPLTASSGELANETTEVSVIKRVGKPEEIADAVYYLLGNESSFITGQVIVVDGGFTLK